MVKIKGWKKSLINKETKEFIQYDSKDNSIYITKKDVYQYLERVQYWEVYDFNMNMKKVHRFKTKKEAKAYAFNYMRLHPNG